MYIYVTSPVCIIPAFNCYTNSSLTFKLYSYMLVHVVGGLTEIWANFSSCGGVNTNAGKTWCLTTTDFC